MRTQISTSVSTETRKQANELVAQCGYSLRDVISIAIEKLHTEKIYEVNKMNYETKARERVRNTPELNAVRDVIFYDWGDWDNHMEWIATAPVAEILDWAETVG